MEGSVKFFNTDRGFGFIQPSSGGADLFVHISQVADGVKLREGARVAFSIGENRGRTVATDVKILQ